MRFDMRKVDRKPMGGDDDKMTVVEELWRQSRWKICQACISLNTQKINKPSEDRLIGG